ncbi:MAG: PQQ-like beta-propeller repeat protein [Candidatus Bathyarchaeota archaeon]|nr:PQQ-like beta-propeller repeat protein [Candidatus Bathyarchaeum sp.]
MKLLKTKTKSTTSILALLLISTAIIANIPLGQAVTEVETYSFITVNPNPIGVGQTAFVTFWLDQVTPTASASAGDRWEDITVKIEAPDGTVENLTGNTLDAVAAGWTTYTPTQVGIYTFQMIFPGQHIETFGGWPAPQQWNHTYLPSVSAIAELTVQQDPIDSLGLTPLPTDYWSRPINAETHGWGSITGNWLAGASGGPHGPRAYGPSGNYNPYADAPDAGHIVWTKELTFGGVVGGEYGDVPYYPGESYERKFAPSIIMNGRLYYNNRLGSSTWQGFTCVDLQTGEELWTKAEGTLTCGQLLDVETPNQHGVIPYLWSASGTTWKMYDAFSGDWILDVSNVSSGTLAYGTMGELLVYTFDGTAGTLSLWNSTLAIQPNIDTAWSWRPTAGTTVDGNNGKQWTVNVPAVPGGSINKVENDIVYVTQAARFSAVNVLAGFDANTGEHLWGPVSVNRGDTLGGSMYEISGGSYAEFVRETMQWYGYDVTTGEQIWGPTEAYTNAWGFYQTYCDSMVAGDLLIAASYDGTIHCYNITTGTHMWDHFTGSAGFETPYGNWPYKDSAITVADGKVYVVNNEHSPSTPFYRGNQMHCIDLETGIGLWNISFMGLAPVIADGYAVAHNYLDNRIYCFGMGQTETSVIASPAIVTDGSSVLITGSVTDQSTGNPGSACVSADSMSDWMEYLYMGAQMPTDVEGISVTLTAIDPNGNSQNIDEVTTDLSGNFGTMWTPPVEGTYQITATFEGTESYGSSYSTAYMGVDPALSTATPIEPEEPETPTEPETPEQPETEEPTTETEEPATETALLTTETAIIAAIAIAAIIGAVSIFVLRKRK